MTWKTLRQTSPRTASIRLRTIEKGLVKVSSELTQDRRALSASVRDVVNSIGIAGTTSTLANNY